MYYACDYRAPFVQSRFSVSLLSSPQLFLDSLPLKTIFILETEYSQADTVLKFLQFTPSLEALAIVQKGWCNKFNEDAFTSNLVPRCLLLHLKTIEIQKFEGSPEELKLVKYFWKNARILQVLIIQSGTIKTIAALEKKTQIMELLLMNPRASTSCKVKFQFPSSFPKKFKLVSILYWG
ncbi:hypothetical protein C5167_020036 [Papaver somniferum]|uniref:FBD domain-containing protein n=1 Tax=Papaver somniferum TaxID=3469 RepID=A0A4Y7IVT5_PAPSO|nr:hypothetical protein C5167_020036 [Papaver somniferum]